MLARHYRLLFSPKHRRSGPKGPAKELVDASVAIKRRNPTWGCPRIAQQIALAFDIDIGKDVVRRVLAARYRPDPDASGPSWLTFLGHAKDSLWSVDLFRSEGSRHQGEDRLPVIKLTMRAQHARRTLRSNDAL